MFTNKPIWSLKQVRAMYNNINADASAYQDYNDALRKAFWRNLANRIRHRCNDLIPANEVFKQLNLQEQNNLGLQNIPIDKIVSSTGRYRDFDLAFLPLRKDMENRWVNIARTYYNGVALPPAMVYKVGEIYIVEDGNHRISVARANGQKTIRAIVIEIDDSTLFPEPSCTRLGFKV
jgi:hypothetical protein